jgi:hypothetical protein
MQYHLQVLSETTQRFQPLRRRFNDFLLGLEDFSAPAFDQNAHGFPHQPTWSSEHLQPIRRWHHQRDAVAPHHSHALGKSIEDFQLESRHINLLELFCRIRHRLVFAAGFPL